MALDSEIQWEFRESGSNNNGVGFSDLDPGTSIDYSQQDAAEKTFDDLAMVAGGTTITSASAQFEAADVGNILFIRSGTNFQYNYFQITSFNSNTSVEIDRDATDGGNGSLGIANLGGARADMSTWFNEDGVMTYFYSVIIAGNTLWFKSGDYTGAQMHVQGAATDFIRMIGYNAVRGDNPTGDDRPTLTGTAATLLIYPVITASYRDVYHYYKNLKLSILNGAACNFNKVNKIIFENCRFYSANVLGPVGVFEGRGGDIRIIDCEFFSDDDSITDSIFSVSGLEVDGAARSLIVDSCYLHLSEDDANCSPGKRTDRWINTIFSRSPIYTGSDGATFMKNCVIHTSVNSSSYSGIGIYQGVNDPRVYIYNNVLDGYYRAVQAYDKDAFLDFNNWWNNTTDVASTGGLTPGENATYCDPKYRDADNDDFSYWAASKMRKAAYTSDLGRS